jgi:peptidoglycan-associated lipoprotein
MCNVKGSATLVIAAAAMILFLTGCETTKHAEVISAEELAAKAQASASQGTGSDGDQGGIPLAGQGMSEDSLSVGDSSGTAAGTGSSEAPVDAGSHGYEGQQFVRALIPSDFVPESPPLPTMGNGGASTDSGMGTSGTSGSEEEVVRLPDHDSMEPLSPSDLGDSQDNGSSGGGGLGHVYFDFDQYVIRNDGVSTLQENAQLLSAKFQDSNVLIEGHCDERGTTDYNLVLGERRAQAVKDYLVDLGVASSRIKIVSYGKERPSCTGTEESCYQENRRGHVMLQ